MALFYIQIRKNQMLVRMPENRQQACGGGEFSNSRLLVANFSIAEKVLYDLIAQLHFRRWFNPKKVVIHALEMNEGGLSQVEERVMQEITARPLRQADLIVISSPRPLADAEVIELQRKRR